METVKSSGTLPHPLPRVAAVWLDTEDLVRASPPVDVEDLLEADGTVFETPVPSSLLTVAKIAQFSCMCMRQCVAIQQPSNVTYQQVPCSSSGMTLSC